MLTLSNLFNKFILFGRFPPALKFANVTPDFKKGDKQLLNNYRPISLLSGVGKTMERAVHKHFITIVYTIIFSRLSNQASSKVTRQRINCYIYTIHFVKLWIMAKKEVFFFFFFFLHY